MLALSFTRCLVFICQTAFRGLSACRRGLRAALFRLTGPSATAAWRDRQLTPRLRPAARPADLLAPRCTDCCPCVAGALSVAVALIRPPPAAGAGIGHCHRALSHYTRCRRAAPCSDTWMGACHRRSSVSFEVSLGQLLACLVKRIRRSGRCRTRLLSRPMCSAYGSAPCRVAGFEGGAESKLYATVRMRSCQHSQEGEEGAQLRRRRVAAKEVDSMHTRV